MATLDWSQCPAVESIPGKVSGAWVFVPGSASTLVFDDGSTMLTHDEEPEE